MSSTSPLRRELGGGPRPLTDPFRNRAHFGCAEQRYGSWSAMRDYERRDDHSHEDHKEKEGASSHSCENIGGPSRLR